MTEKLGVYFSANDNVYKWAIAFLNSFRKFNPQLELYLVPFDDSCDKLINLSSKYNFKVYIDDSFARLEKIGQSLELGYSSYGPYWFRRYAAFWGPLDHFMYLDVRQIILDDLNPLINILQHNTFNFIYYDCAINQVYEPGLLRTKFLAKNKGRGFNSGRWAAKKNLFNIDDFEKYAKQCIVNRNSLNPRNTDQAFINYCCDMNDNIVSGQFSEILGEYVQNGWAGQEGNIYKDKNGNYRLWNYGGLDHKKKLFLLHWAGFPLSPIMPKLGIFLRYSDYSFIKKILFRLKIVFYLPHILIRNRYINHIYHKLKQD